VTDVFVTKTRSLAALALALAAALAGCVGDKAEYVHSVWRGADTQPIPRTVYYVTDRVAEAGWPGGFGKHWSDAPSCGTVTARIPPANLASEPYPTGALDKKTQPMACGTGLDGFAHAMKATGARCVLLYVHGFNTLFDGAALRAAQLAIDTATPCLAATFSWSSEGEVGRYIADIEHSAYAAPELEALLRALAATGLEVNIVAHSIGTRVTLQALSSITRHKEPAPENFVREMILAAADVGADPVNNDFAHLLADAKPFVRRATIYASAGDAVLAVSAVAHGDVLRAGRRVKGDRDLETPPGADHIVDVVDATDAPAELLGHSYFGLSYEAVGDIALTLDGVPVEARLKQTGDRPATLVCKSACDAAGAHYALNVAEARKPDFFTRLIRRLVPFIPRIELAPLTGSGD
jgi:esterase/lipase superfamily enzyme